MRAIRKSLRSRVCLSLQHALRVPRIGSPRNPTSDWWARSGVCPRLPGQSLQRCEPPVLLVLLCATRPVFQHVWLGSALAFHLEHMGFRLQAYEPRFCRTASTSRSNPEPRRARCTTMAKPIPALLLAWLLVAMLTPGCRGPSAGWERIRSRWSTVDSGALDVKVFATVGGKEVERYAYSARWDRARKYVELTLPTTSGRPQTTTIIGASTDHGTWEDLSLLTILAVAEDHLASELLKGWAPSRASDTELLWDIRSPMAARSYRLALEAASFLPHSLVIKQRGSSSIVRVDYSFSSWQLPTLQPPPSAVGLAPGVELLDALKRSSVGRQLHRFSGLSVPDGMMMNELGAGVDDWSRPGVRDVRNYRDIRELKSLDLPSTWASPDEVLTDVYPGPPGPPELGVRMVFRPTAPTPIWRVDFWFRHASPGFDHLRNAGVKTMRVQGREVFIEGPYDDFGLPAFAAWWEPSMNAEVTIEGDFETMDQVGQKARELIDTFRSGLGE